MSNQTPNVERFYILSVKWTTSESNANRDIMVWYRPKSAGYTWYLSAAGLFDEERAKEICDGCDYLVAVPYGKAIELSAASVSTIHLKDLISEYGVKS